MVNSVIAYLSLDLAASKLIRRSVYHHHGKTLVLLLYMDDILLITNDPTMFKHLICTPSKNFSIKDLRCLLYFMGIQAQFHLQRLFLHQPMYAKEILHHSHARMTKCNPMLTTLPLKLDQLSHGT